MNNYLDCKCVCINDCDKNCKCDCEIEESCDCDDYLDAFDYEGCGCKYEFPYLEVEFEKAHILNKKNRLKNETKMNNKKTLNMIDERIIYVIKVMQAIYDHNYNDSEYNTTCYTITTNAEANLIYSIYNDEIKILEAIKKDLEND